MLGNQLTKRYSAAREVAWVDKRTLASITKLTVKPNDHGPYE